MTWRRPWPLFDVADHHSTFGASLSLDDDIDLGAELNRAAAHPDAAGLTAGAIGARLDQDHEIAVNSRRWTENDDGMLVQGNTSFVPGDVVAMRSTAIRQIALAMAPEDQTFAPRPANRSEVERRAAVLTRLVYAARPYWLPQQSAWGIMAIKPLSDPDREALRLPGPALVLFSSGMEITKHYVGADLRLVDRLNYVRDLDPTTADADGASFDPVDHPPLTVRSGTLGILRYYSDLQKGADVDDLLFRYQLMGVVLLPDVDGSLTDAVIWVLRRIDPAHGTTSRHIAAGTGLSVSQSGGTFFMVEGRLSNSLLQPIAESLAAVASWGSWTAPDEFAEPIPSAGPALRKLAKRSKFKKAETHGNIAGVHVLSPRTPQLSYSTTTGTGRSVATHYRVGHWRRYRLGPKEDWHYERRQIPGMIINPGQDKLADIVRVYRLPPPPTVNDPERHD